MFLLVNIDQPELYRKSAALWHVDGHKALPATGKLPAHGALPIVQPLNLTSQTTTMIQQQSSAADQMMLEYLNGMKMMIQAQRDVMMSYPGQPVEAQVLAHSAVLQQQPAIPVPVAKPVEAPPAAMVQPSLPAKVTDVKALLLDVVSDKTGYPNEMLGLEMDLEADLSIDSIKRMEIIGELRDRLGGFNTAADAEEQMMEQLAAIKTLNGLIGWLKTHAGPEEAIAPVQAVNAQPALAKPAPTYAPFFLQTVSDKTGYPVDMLGLDPTSKPT